MRASPRIWGICTRPATAALAVAAVRRAVRAAGEELRSKTAPAGAERAIGLTPRQVNQYLVTG